MDNGWGSASDEDDARPLYSTVVAETLENDPHFGAQVVHSDSDTPTSSVTKSLRRRTSGSSRTISLRTGQDSLSPMHPLRSAGLATAFNVTGITRPHLTRMVTVGSLVGAPPIESDCNIETQLEGQEVLVHEVCLFPPLDSAKITACKVCPGDSLAGISLKYGITLANLRRANHLWASDSIHLRTVLYIPLDQASRIQKIFVDANLAPVSLLEQSFDPEPPNDHLRVQRSSLESIQRIPSSQLSFFPPSSHKTTQPNAPSSFQSTYESGSRHTRSSSYPSQSITSTLPIAASSRDTFISRLSFDSVSSSYSERESEYSSEDLELDDVKHIADKPGDADVDSEALLTPRTTHRTTHSRTPSASSSQVDIRHLSSSPKSYIPPHPQIRTVQLEPSPIMRIPGRKGTKGKGRVREHVPETDYELQNTRSLA